MIVAKISEWLGNQMFIYATVKTFCIDSGIEFKFYHDTSGTHGNSDIKYGHNLETVFCLPKDEKINQIPKLKYNYADVDWVNPTRIDEANIKDNTLIETVTWNPQTFNHNITAIRQWFSFPDDIEEESQKSIDAVREMNNKVLVATHFRTGLDYNKRGYTIAYSYWENAAKIVESNLDDQPIYLCFYDEKTKIVKKFMKKHNSIDASKGLLFDLSAMSKCDAHILCNSTFSIWGALLNQNNPRLIVRPSVYPNGKGYQSDSVFLKEWQIAKAKRNFKSHVLFYIVRFKTRFILRIINSNLSRHISKHISRERKEKLAKKLLK